MAGAAALRALVDGTAIRSPAVGLWRGAPPVGSWLVPGGALGELEILGVRHPVLIPPGAAGIVTESAASRARTSLAYRDLMVRFDPDRSLRYGDAPGTMDQARGSAGLVVRAPSSGRLYLRPRPDKASFVSVGETVVTGQTVCLLEIMKTFHRVNYGAAGLPERARVRAIVAADEADLDQGDIIFELEEL
jgi:acetyl-CoA carboxylase biotin carboxyl carrier protein